MNNFRLFIGIALTPPVSARVSAIMDRMAAQLPFRKWTHPADLHVTLHFLGDTPADRLDPIRHALESTAAETASIALKLTEPGTFGQPAAPRILWLGLNEPSAPGAMSKLHAALAHRLAAAGCALEDRPFRAHLTLARQGAPGCGREALQSAWSTAAAETAGMGPLEWTADRVTLFRSEIGRRPSYGRLFECGFASSTS